MTEGYGTDAELLTLFLEKQDRSALEKLITRNSELIWRVCRQYLRREQDAEDVFQSTFRTLIEQGQQIRNREAVAAWLFQVARREALHQLRLSGRTVTGIEQEQLDEKMARQRGGAGEADIATLFEEIEGLPEKYQASIVLCYLQGRTQEQAASELGLTAPSVKARLARGRELLKMRLSKKGIGIAAVLAAWETNTASAGTIVTGQIVERTVEQCVMHSTTTSGAATASSSLLTKGTTALAISKATKVSVGALAMILGLGVGSWVYLQSPEPERPPTISPEPILPVLSEQQQKSLAGFVADLREQESLYRHFELKDQQTYVNHRGTLVPPPDVQGSPGDPVGDYQEFIARAQGETTRLSTTLNHLTATYHIVNQVDRTAITGETHPVYLVRAQEGEAEPYFQYLESNSRLYEVCDGRRWLIVSNGRKVLEQEKPRFRFFRYAPHKLFTDAFNMGGDSIYRVSFQLSEIVTLDGKLRDLRTPREDKPFRVWGEVTGLQSTEPDTPVVLTIHVYESAEKGAPVPVGEMELVLNRKRNFIPEKTTEYEIRDGRRYKRATCNVLSWQEPQPGVWFPEKMARKMYFESTPGIFELAAEIESKFEIVSLETDYSPEYFGDKYKAAEATIVNEPPR